MTALPGGGTLLGPTPPGATRRTTTIVVAPRGAWSAGQRFVATGRDLARSAGGHPHGRNVRFSFGVDDAGLIVPDGEDRTVPAQLHGRPAQHGLRKHLAQLRDRGLPLGDPESDLHAAILDDVPGTALASGYGRLYEDPTGQSGDQISSSMRLTCVGFNVMHQRREEFDVHRYFEGKPPSIEFVTGDELVWHEDPPMRPHTFRRRRMLQVAPGPHDTVTVTGYFRDTFMRPDGAEVIVHEYGLEAVASGDPLALDSVEAVPGSLPLDHCPLAASSTLALEGLPLSEVESTVRRTMSGARGCTHLNDELRALRLVPEMLSTLRSGRSPR